MKKVLISIIIPVKNESKNIVNCLNSIIKSNCNKDLYEIIVVDNYSSDQTVNLAKKYTKNVFFSGPERSAQRNFGAKKAKGKYLLFLDADMLISKNLLSECLFQITTNNKQQITNNQTIALYIPEVILGNSYWNRVRRFERYFYNATSIDAVRFIKKDVFWQVGGYDEKLNACEDWDLDLKLKKLGRFKLINAPLFHNEIGFSLKKFFFKKASYTKSGNHYKHKWPNSPEVKMQFSVKYRLLNVFLRDGQIKQFYQHPNLALGIYFLKIGQIVIYLFN